MPRDESFYPADWLRIAEKDLRRVGYLLSAQDLPTKQFQADGKWGLSFHVSISENKAHI